MDNLSTWLIYSIGTTDFEKIMNTLTNAYTKKLSSGTITALLLFSGLLFLVPAAFPAIAAQNATLPSLKVTPNVVVATTPVNTVTLKITNPLANAYAITEITLFAPTGWAFTDVGTAGGANLNHVTVATASAIEFTNQGPNLPLDPGFSDTVTIGTVTTPASPAASNPPMGSFTTTVVDQGSDPASYVGPSFAITAIASTTVTVTLSSSPTGTDYIAGTAPYTATATLSSGQPGVPVTWSFANGAYPTVTLANGNPNTGAMFTPSSGSTSSPTPGVADSATTSTTFQPSFFAGDSSSLVASLGNSGVTGGCPLTCNVVTEPGTPSVLTVSVNGGSGASSTKPVYITNFGTPSFATTLYAKVTSTPTNIQGSTTDAYGNALSGVTFAAGQGCQITSFGGSFDTGTGTSVTSNSQVGPAAKCTVLGVVGNTLPYFQSSNYGSSGYVTVSFTGTFNGAAFTITGTSQTLYTSTFDSAINTVTTVRSCGIITCGASQVAAALTTSATANTISVTYTLTHAQSGVPVTVIMTNSSFNTGTFVGGTGSATHKLNQLCLTAGGVVCNGVTTSRQTGTNVTLTTTVTAGVASVTATFTVDTLAGDAINAFQATVADPFTTNTANILGVGGTSANGFTTIAGVPATFIVSTFFDAAQTVPTIVSVGGQNIYIDISINDIFGNRATNPGNQIQISLSASAGTLSATSVYIASSRSDTHTAPSFGSILLTLPSSIAVGTVVTITASGYYPTATATVTIVSASPTLTVTAPVPAADGNVYSNTAGVAFKGTTKVSTGLFTTPATTIKVVKYQLDGGAWTAATGTASWNFALTLADGKHTVNVNASDTAGDVSAMSSFVVVVDTSKPTITAVTTTGSIITAGSPVQFNIVDLQGDLDSTTVVATSNSTATLSVAITGSNNLGSSVTYSVSVSGLGAGHWKVTLNAKDLVGNAATAVSTIIYVNVPSGSTFTSAGASSAVSNGFTGDQVTFKNNAAGSETVNVYFVWYNSANQIVSVGAQLNVVFASGASATFFNSYGTSGTYTVQVFIQDTSGNGISASYQATVTIP